MFKVLLPFLFYKLYPLLHYNSVNFKMKQVLCVSRYRYTILTSIFPGPGIMFPLEHYKKCQCPFVTVLLNAYKKDKAGNILNQES